MTIPLSLYIHIPWCIRKCPYCDFHSLSLANNLPEEAYIAALIQDFDNEILNTNGRPLESIFIGGGTPSLFSPKSFDRLLNEIHRKINFRDDIEITMEANPGTFDKNKMVGFRAAGINRLSIGIQSFQDDKLKTLERIHDGQTAQNAIKTAKEAGFENINLDLMHGLPNQTISDALFDINTAIQAEPTHLSWYQLTIEPNTRFYKKPPTLPNEDLLCGIQEEGYEQLKTHDFIRYEISAYARPNYQCHHNLNYWQFGDYIGIGSGAHGKMSKIDSQNNKITSIIRSNKTTELQKYMQNSFIEERHNVHLEKLPLEFMMNVLRLVHGIPLDLFQKRTGFPLKTIENELLDLYGKGLIEKPKEILKTTLLGLRFLNDCLTVF